MGHNQLKRLLLSGIIATVLTADVLATLVRPIEWITGKPGVVPRQIGYFLPAGVFIAHPTNNYEITIWGLPAGRSPERTNWIELPRNDYFRLPGGLQYHRMNPAITGVNAAGESREQVLDFMGRKIRARHNRLHPEQPIERVAYEESVWPVMEDGPQAGRTHPGATTRFWTITKGPGP